MVIKHDAVRGLMRLNFCNEICKNLVYVTFVIRVEGDSRVSPIVIDILFVILETPEHCPIFLVVTVKHKVI